MSLLTQIPILGDAIDKIIDKAVSWIPDATERANRAAEIRKYAHDEVLGQLDINKAEIGTGKLIGMWRSAIGWAGAFAIAWNFIVMPFLVSIVLLFNPNFPVSKIPMIDWTKLGPIILGMLGLA